MEGDAGCVRVSYVIDSDDDSDAVASGLGDGVSCRVCDEVTVDETVDVSTSPE